VADLLNESAADILGLPDANWVNPPEVRDGVIEIARGSGHTVWWITTRSWEGLCDDDFAESERPLLVEGTKLRRWAGLVDRAGQRSRVVAYRVVRDG